MEQPERSAVPDGWSPGVSADLTEQELRRRKDFLEFRDEDVNNLTGIGDLARRCVASVVEDFYKHLMIGAIHERVGLLIKAYLGMYNYSLCAVAGQLDEAYRTNPQRAWSVVLSLMNLTFLDVGLASVLPRTIRLREVRL